MEYGIIEFILIALLLICMIVIFYKLRKMTIKPNLDSYVPYERIENDYTTIEMENYIITYIDDEF